VTKPSTDLQRPVETEEADFICQQRENVLMEEYEGRFSEWQRSWMTVSDLLRPSKQAAWISQSASRKRKRNERST